MHGNAEVASNGVGDLPVASVVRVDAVLREARALSGGYAKEVDEIGAIGVGQLAELRGVRGELLVVFVGNRQSAAQRLVPQRRENHKPHFWR